METRCIVFISVVMITVTSFCQDSILATRISVNYDHVPLNNVLKELNKNYHLHFSYSETIIQEDIQISIRKNNITLKEMLNEMFEGTKIDYKVMNHQVVLYYNRQKLKKYTLNGFVTDSLNGEKLIGVAVYAKNINNGVITNPYGFYSITLPKGLYEIHYLYMGYHTKIRTINLHQNMRMDIQLSSSDILMEGVEIVSDNESDIISSLSQGSISIETKNIRFQPSLFGIPDIALSISMLPGVNVREMTSSNLFIRGGSSDQTVFYMDGAPVFYASHFGGFNSIFNSDAINKVVLHKGNAEAGTGEGLSSSIDIRLKEGNLKKPEVKGGIGTIATRICVEAPLKKDHSSFIISARRTYIDLLIKLIDKNFRKNYNIYFYDMSIKANTKLNNHNRLYVSAYGGQDVFGIDTDIQRFNKILTLRWNHIYNPKLFMNATSAFSQTDFFQNSEYLSDNIITWKSRIQGLETKFDFTWYLSPRFHSDMGTGVKYQKFLPYNITAKNGEGTIYEENGNHEQIILPYIYYGSTFRLWQKFTVYAGIRASLYTELGPETRYTYEYDEYGSSYISDSTVYSVNEPVETHFGIEPRINVCYRFNNCNSLKLSYGRTHMYTHMITYENFGLAINRWVPGTGKYPYQKSDNYILGYYKKLSKSKIYLSTEVYYRYMRDLLESHSLDFIIISEDSDELLKKAMSWAAGVEILVKIDLNKITASAGYTLSKVMRKTDGFNNNRYYYPGYDRRHDIKLSGTWHMSHRISLAMNWVYTSGQPYSQPAGMYKIKNLWLVQIDKNHINTARFPDYHRLDFNLQIRSRRYETKKWKGYWNIGISNIYWRRNTMGLIYVNQSLNNSEHIIIPKKYFFYVFVPSISYNFSF